MAKTEALTIITVIIFIVPVAVFIPVIMAESNAEYTERTLVLEETDRADINSNLEVEVEQVSSNDAEILIIDRNNGEMIAHNVAEGNTQTYVFGNGEVEVTLVDIHTNERISIFVETPTSYAQGSAEESANDFMDYIIIIPVLIIILMVLFSVIDTEGI